MTQTVKLPPPFIYFPAQAFFRFVIWVCCRLTITGREHIPAQGPFMVVFNHSSMADAPLLFALIPKRMAAFAADKYRHKPVLAQLLALGGPIWVARGEADLEAIKIGLQHLRAGGILGYSPEGTRSPTGALQKGKTGAAYLADRVGVPLLPIGIAGADKVFGHLRRLRRARVTVVIGEPFRLPPDGRAKGAKLDEYTDVIMRRIAALLPADYRGEYADTAP